VVICASFFLFFFGLRLCMSYVPVSFALVFLLVFS